MPTAHCEPHRAGSFGGSATPWLRERTFWLVLLLATVVYGSRLPDLTLRGEEPRRGQVAVEMLERQDWVVPRQQGRVFADRPPLQNWAIAGLIEVLGRDPLAVRLPSFLATLAIVAGTYVYARRFLSPTGATAASAGLATMVQVLELGRLGETEALFMALVAGSLFAWHARYESRGADLIAWTTGYGLAALAALAKGPQGPLYFMAAVWLHLLVRGDWRGWLRPAHWMGVAVFAGVVAAWHIPYQGLVTPEEARGIWFRLAANRFDFSQPGEFLLHLASYPFEVLACMLPWSLLLAGGLVHGFRGRLGPAQPAWDFACCAVAASFPSVWLAPEALTRYYMPLYPAFAVLAGIVVERAFASGESEATRRVWSRFAAIACGAMLAAAALFAAAGLLPPLRATALVQPAGWAVLYAVATLGLVRLAWGARQARLGPRAAWGVWAIAAFLGLTYAGPLTNIQINRSGDTETAVRALESQLPAGSRLVSFDEVHSLVAWHYPRPIELRSWPSNAAEAEGVEYFCVTQYGDAARQLPFAWEPVAVIPCDRSRRERPRDKVIVGRRMNELATRADAAWRR